MTLDIPANKIITIVGHYGSGKSNIAVNLAVKYNELGLRTAVADIDIVNPYFRSADSMEMLRSRGIRCIAPEYANTNVDLPTLPAELYGACADIASGRDDTYILLDVGGDDDGAAALGGLRESLMHGGYEMLFVINAYRPLTAEPEEAVAVLRDIEARCSLKATGIINNSNLGDETTADIVLDSLPYAEKVCGLSGLPLFGHTALRRLEGELGDTDNIIFIDNVTKNIWNMEV